MPETRSKEPPVAPEKTPAAEVLETVVEGRLWARLDRLENLLLAWGGGWSAAEVVVKLLDPTDSIERQATAAGRDPALPDGDPTGGGSTVYS